MRKNTRVRGKRQDRINDFVQAVNHFDWSGLSSAANWARTVGPVYLTSIGLAAAYGWGWTQTYGGVFGFALAAFVATCELIKPSIGEKIEDSPKRSFWLLLTAGVVIAFCGLSGLVAFNAAEAPTRAYEAGQRAIVAADGVVERERVRLAGFDCPADMPASRCERNRAANGAAIVRATRDLETAEADAAAARSGAPAQPSVSVPAVAWYVKLLLGLGIDFVLFVFPWAARGERARPVAVTEAEIPIAGSAPPIVLKTNDGGWATRRAKYGPTGQRAKNVVPLRRKA